MEVDIFIELSIVLAIAFSVVWITRFLKQPAIIGYILSGILSGPFIFDIISSTDTFTVLAQKGVALLLFLVGLSLNPKVIKDVGKISLITGVGQVVFTASIGFMIAKALGFSTIVSAYLAIALTFSSTIVIMKLLSDKRSLDSLYAKISVGFLIVQDFIVIILLLVISSLGSGMDLATVAFQTVIKGVLSISLLFLISVYVLPKITKEVAKSQDLLFLFSLAWCFGVATIFNELNFSIEAGALLAGMSLSLSPYQLEISSKMKPLRDFFLILFFIMLGSQMIFSNLITNLVPILIFSGFVLIGNPIIVMILMGIFGYTKRTGFLAGLTVAQISEFSLIFITLGISQGHLTRDVLSIATAIALITFAGSTYMIMYSEKIFNFLSPYLSIFEKKITKEKKNSSRKKKHDIILFGYDRIGHDLLTSLHQIKKKFIVVDHDPESIERLTKHGFDSRFGDASSSEVLERVNISKAKMVISTISSLKTNLLIISKVRKKNKKAIVAVVSHDIDHALELYEAGATYVIMPHLLGAKHFSTMLTENKLGVRKFLRDKVAHLEHIKKIQHREKQW